MLQSVDLVYYSRVEYSRVIHTRELTQQDGSKTQDGRMPKNVAQDCAFLVLRDIFIRHSAILSLTAVLLHKVATVINAQVANGG